jgi:thymidylate kinase
MLELIQKFFTALNESNISYCHWKSNASIERALDGREDLDLLVNTRDRHRFEAILTSMKFKKANVTSGELVPSVYHYYGLDEGTGTIVHVHVYYEIITGESLLKNYRLPVEGMIFENITYIHGVRIPRKEVELIFFVIRMILKHIFLAECILLYKNEEDMKRELRWLLQNCNKKKVASLLKKWLPEIDESLFEKCIDALELRHSLFKGIILGRRVRSCLRVYARHSRFKGIIYVNYRFIKAIFRKFIRRRRNKIRSSGGLVIAVVGPEATGKSTLAGEIEKWLGEYFLTYSIHAGKPPSSCISLVPNLFVPFFRKTLPQFRTSEIEPKNKRKVSLLSMMRCAMIAFDRRKLLLKAYRRVSRGAIVICDRYPSCTVGAMDGPRLNLHLLGDCSFSFKKILTKMENRIYKEIPPADIVLELSVPLETAVKRNINRRKHGKETEEYVRRRHAEAGTVSSEKSILYRINTEAPIKDTLLFIKDIIWSHL